MSYRRIVVHAEADPSAEARLACAALVARMFNAQLTGLGTSVEETEAETGASRAITARPGELLEKHADIRLSAAEANFRRHARHLVSHWRILLGAPADALARAARAADLVVTEGCSAEPGSPPDLIGVARLILEAARPVLITPPGLVSFKGERVVVAWKDTGEARRAVVGALPFLRRARNVAVVVVDAGSDGRAQAAEIADFLASHGVEASAIAESAGGASTAVAIRREIRKADADLLVAGAACRYRGGQLVLGDVTRDLLSQAEGFVLFSH